MIIAQLRRGETTPRRDYGVRIVATARRDEHYGERALRRFAHIIAQLRRGETTTRRDYGEGSVATARRDEHYVERALRRFAHMIIILIFPLSSFAWNENLSSEMRLKSKIIWTTYLKLCSITPRGCDYLNKKIGIYVTGSDGSAFFWSENSDVTFEYGYKSEGNYNWSNDYGSYSSQWHHIGAYKLPSGSAYGGSVWGSKLVFQSGNEDINYTGNGSSHLPYGNNFPDRLSECFTTAETNGWFAFYGFGIFSQSKDGGGQNVQHNLTCTYHSSAPSFTQSDGWTLIPTEWSNEEIVSDLVIAYSSASSQGYDMSPISADFTDAINWLRQGVSTTGATGGVNGLENPNENIPLTPSTPTTLSVDFSSITSRQDRLYDFLSSTGNYQIDLSTYMTAVTTTTQGLMDAIYSTFSPSSNETWDLCFRFGRITFAGRESDELKFCAADFGAVWVFEFLRVILKISSVVMAFAIMREGVR